jgi:hypothetical protein
MAHTLTHPVLASNPYRQAANPPADSLDAMRGILFAVLLSIAGFWIPLALVLSG